MEIIKEHREGCDWDSFHSQYAVLKTIGQGGYAKVKLAHHRLTGTLVAVKVLEKQRMWCSPVISEKDIMRTLDHPNVISLFQLIESEKRTYIIMELVKGQQLYDYIKKSGYLQEDDARRIFRQMLNAMSYCHELGIIHRDLKPDNIMVDGNGHVTVIDFGLGTKVKPGQKIIFPGGIYKFGAPEQLLHKPYDGPKADVWALGVTLYLMVTGKYPFGDVISGLKSKIVHGMYTVPSILSKELKDLLRRLLSVDPRHRPTAQEAIGHPWLKETEASQAKEKKKEVPSLPDAAIVQAMQCIGFKREDIEESVINKKFDECMASYYFLKDFLDSETCLLLAAPIYLKEKMGVEDIPPRGVYLLLGKNRHLGKKLFLPGLLDDMLYKLDMLDP
ncbi:hypothetical protein STEG23_025091 [Scotinomys teguina]